MNIFLGQDADADSSGIPGVLRTGFLSADTVIADNTRLYFLHPQYSGWNALLSRLFLSAPSGPCFYYRPPAPDPGFSGWYEDFCSEAANLLHLHLPPLVEDPSPDLAADCGAAFGAALAQRVNKCLLLLDELNLGEQDALFQAFVRALLAHLSGDAILIIKPQFFYSLPWSDLLADRTAVLLDEFGQAPALLASAAAKNLPFLEVYAFGREAVFVNGRQVAQWNGVLTRNLFCFFMDQVLVTRDQIFRTFWPHLARREATNIFHVTKRKIGERLAEAAGQPCELTRYASGFYRESGLMRRFYDVVLFEELAAIGLHSSSADQRFLALRQALDIYHGPFLPQNQMPWAIGRREALSQLRVDLLVALGDLYRQRGQIAEALREYHRALDDAPLREDLHREVMRLYMAQGDAEAARAQLYQLRDRLPHAIHADTQAIADQIDQSAAR